MKKSIIFNLLYFFICIVVIISCEKENAKSPPIDIHGVWQGSWQTDDTLMQGTFLAPASQNGSKFSGEMFIRIHGPGGAGYRPEYFGNISGNQPRVIAEISGVEVSGNGSVTNDTVSGTFSVKSLDLQGSFEGSKYPMSTLETEDIYSIQLSDELYSSVFAVEDELWISYFPPGNYLVINQTGEELRSQVLSDDIYSEALASDGTYLWLEDYDYIAFADLICQYDRNSNLLQSFVRPLDVPVGNMCCSGQDLYLTFHGETTIYKCSTDGQLTDSTAISHITYSDFVKYQEGFLLSTYAPYLFYYDMSGNLIEAFEVPKPIFSLTVTASGDIIGLTEETISDDSGWKHSYNIFKLTGL